MYRPCLWHDTIYSRLTEELTHHGVGASHGSWRTPAADEGQSQVAPSPCLCTDSALRAPGPRALALLSVLHQAGQGGPQPLPQGAHSHARGSGPGATPEQPLSPIRNWAMGLQAAWVRGEPRRYSCPGSVLRAHSGRGPQIPGFSINPVIFKGVLTAMSIPLIFPTKAPDKGSNLAGLRAGALS